MQRLLRIMKFGGTSVADASCIRRVAEIVKNNYRESDVVVIVSAMSGVTNMLLDAATQAEAKNRARVTQILEEVRNQHETATRALIHAEPERNRVRGRLEELLEECTQSCESTAALGELTPRARDAISSMGERLSAPLVAAALASYGLMGEALEATELIVTDSCHGAADPKMDLTAERCEHHVRPLLRKGIIPIVTGFIGATETGALTTLGRGGSDYSATIVGAALQAAEIIIWTDVDGILTADPRLVPDAITIPEISYREAAELAHFGAKVLHPKTLRPVMQDGVPVWIRNTFSPGKRGTKITPIGNANRGGVKAVTAIANTALITIGGPVANADEAIARILATAKSIRTDVFMISRSSSWDSISLVVAAALAQRTVEALHQEFSNELNQEPSDHIAVDTGIAILTVVGQHLNEVREIAEHAIAKLKRESVNVLATGQGSSACNVSFVVPSKDLHVALATTHGEFKSSDQVSSQNIRALGERLRAETASAARRHRTPVPASHAKILDEPTFLGMIALERRRTERSRKPALLMLLDLGYLSRDKNDKALNNVLTALSLATRDTDATGWYKDRSVVGVMFTEIGIDGPGAILGTIMHRVSEILRSNLSLENSSQMNISLHVFPENWNKDTSAGNPTLYPDIERREKTQRFALTLKRMIDIVGSAFAIVLFAPVFLLVAALVKLGSKGPILFTQERVGQFGKPFPFLKFRSMYANNDPKIHQEFMKQVISGNHDKGSKMENDPRITRIGGFLRKSSLDELPQFFSVLKGDMSLVGPRPPLAYECQEYDIWHRRRVLEVKPGITGLWQVKGRSRLRFDEMVRLDLQYVRTWSLWLDIKIMLKTPISVLRGGDAF
jgi:aspartate kinase